MLKIEPSWYDTEDQRFYCHNREGSAAIRFTVSNTNVIIQAEGVNWSTRTTGCAVVLEYTKTS